MVRRMLMMPLIAVGAAAGIIPIIVHLMHRQKTTPVAWGAMQFLLEAPRQQRRKARLDYWLLLLCRMALLILLALMLARPLVLASKYNPLATNTAADIAVVLDHSLSMGRRSGETTLFAQGINQVQKIAGLMRPDDSLSIVLAEHTPRRLVERPVAGTSAIAALLETLHHEDKPNTGLTDAAIPEALQAARRLINHGGNIRKLIFVISDEQRSGWLIDNQTVWHSALGGLAGLDRSVEVFSLPVNLALASPNITVSGVNLTPAFLGVGRPVQVTATVANVGPGAMGTIPLTLTVDGKAVASQQIAALEAGQAQTIRFDHTFTTAGAHWVRIAADVVDALEADNAALAAVHVWPRLPVLIIDGQLTGAGSFPASMFLQAALEPADGGALVASKVVSVSEAAGEPLDNYFVVIVNDVPELSRELVGHLHEFVTAGHGVWFILGPRATPAFFNNTLAKTALLPVTLRERRTARPASAVDVKDPASPLVALLTAAERNAFTGVALNQWWAVDLLGGDQHVVLAAANGDPLVVEHAAGAGKVVLWTTSVEGQWNNLPLVINFLPLVYETLYDLAGGSAKGLNRRLESGESIFWSGPITPALTAARITHPDASVHPATALLSSAGRWIINYSDTSTPGLYELHFAPPEIPQPVYYSVNIDRRELDPAVLGATDLAWLKEQGYLKERITEAGLAAALGAQNRGTELWPHLALAVLLLLVVETLLTRRIVRLQVQEDLPATILTGGHA